MRIKYRSTDTAACSDGVNFAMAGAAAISAVWGFSAIKYRMKLARIQQKQDSPQIKKLVGETEEWTCVLSLMHFLSLAVYLCFSAAALLVTVQNDRSINSWVGWQEESTNLDPDRSTQARNVLIAVFTIINLLHAVFISMFIYLRITFFNFQVRLPDWQSSDIKVIVRIAGVQIVASIWSVDHLSAHSNLPLRLAHRNQTCNSFIKSILLSIPFQTL
ncbi:hypothetical protein WR25_02651 [Diploscapter pachys]|uniref:Uncharacterized protein n=1 Tax=Diploscapter pachys TaxID=2018661 RepID=A0A2A2LIU3_9BILA|nr:hypothetical protein WR25_02651 [Diploscapter pachys]